MIHTDTLLIHTNTVDTIDMGMGQVTMESRSHQNNWDLWMFIPLKMLFIGIDP